MVCWQVCELQPITTASQMSELIVAGCIGVGGGDDVAGDSEQRDGRRRCRFVRLLDAIAVQVEPDPVTHGVPQRGDSRINRGIDVRRYYAVCCRGRSDIRLAHTEGERWSHSRVVGIGVGATLAT